MQNFSKNNYCDESKLIAFYLPQYHRIPENSEWWGPGFTEWTNVVQGRPNFEGHYQPHLPRDLGFYDLSQPGVMYEQAELAKSFGVHGFCFYYYWFSGRRILERPLDNFLKSDIDINFCLCWANENWTRTWEGDTKSILMSQNYADDDDEKFFASLIDYFNDERYIRVDGKPMLVVYRAKEIPDPKRSFAKWRALAVKHGFLGLHIVVVEFSDIATSTEVDADALVEFLPHKFTGPQNVFQDSPKIINPNFAGRFIDYHKAIAQSCAREVPNFKLYRGISPSWDNTARRQDTATIFVNANPDLYGQWLRYLRAYTREISAEAAPSQSDNFIFINAWNEWGEGSHLEPDLLWGLQYLEQTLQSSYYSDSLATKDQVRDSVLHHVAQQMSGADDETNLHRQLSALKKHKPGSNLIYKIIARLKKFPVIYKSVRLVYWLLYRLKARVSARAKLRINNE